MSAPPEGLTLEHDRDLGGRERRPLIRWAITLALTIFVLLGLVNVFGQRPAATVARAGAAELEVSTPRTVRGGLYFQSRFQITAVEELREATLVLDRQWLDGMTLNTVEPAPLGEASRDGRLALELGHIPAGDRYLLFLQFQVNPTTVGRRTTGLDLYDGDRLLLHVDRSLTVWP